MYISSTNDRLRLVDSAVFMKMSLETIVATPFIIKASLQETLVPAKIVFGDK